MAKPPRAVVLGSVHMDLIATASRLPGPGESVGSGTFAMAPGGKAGYQAVALARSGCDTDLIARLGDDDFGRNLRRAVEAEGVGTTLVATDPEAPTGASTVFNTDGDYCSIIAPGAAGRLGSGDLERARPLLEAVDALVLQLEVPAAISAAAAAIAKRAGKMVVLNASPEPDLSAMAELPEAVTHLVVNRVEASRLLGRPVAADATGQACGDLMRLFGAEVAVITLGPDGAVACDRNGSIAHPGFPATVIDPVGAGDSFLGTFVAALLTGLGLDAALERGVAAGSLAVARTGGYRAIPTAAEVDAFLRKA